MSRMYLSGSANTGNKIMKNSMHFSYVFSEKEELGDGILYRFNWKFDFQQGYMSILVRSCDGKISNSSLIDTSEESSHRFDRPLGLYNDSSLVSVFEEVLKSINVVSKGIYTTDFY